MSSPVPPPTQDRLDGDALGDDLLHVAFGLEVCEDLSVMGSPVALSLEGGDDGGDRVDARLGGVEAVTALPLLVFGPVWFGMVRG